MGSCISKCKPKKSLKKEKEKQQQEESQTWREKNNTLPLVVQDKLVISQPPISSPPPPRPRPSNKSVTSPLSPSSSANYPTTSSSSSSCSFLSSESSSISSALSSELDRSTENPYKIRLGYPTKVANYKTRSSANKPIGPKQHPPSPQRIMSRPTAQKRPRCSSPSNLTRQKSFRREPNRPISSISESNSAHQKSFRREPERPVSRSSRDLRPISPSPSRRYKGEGMTTSMRRENGYVNSRRHSGSKNLVGKRENEGIKRVGSKLEELAIGELICGQEMDWMPIEDANNPHIALDCFIFL